MTMYMKIDNINGDDIDGDVTMKGYQNWIEIETASVNLGRKIKFSPGRANDRESSVPSFDDVVVTKKVDKTTPLIFAQACCGKAIAKVQIDLCHTGDQSEAYRQLVLHNVLISNYSEDLSSDDKPIETITLNFTKIENSYTAYGANHIATSPIKSGYDLVQMQKI